MAAKRDPDLFHSAFEMTLSRFHIDLSHARALGLERIWRRVMLLGFGERDPNAGQVLENFIYDAAGKDPLANLKKRMELQLLFFERLFAPSPQNKFRISFKKVHEWPDLTYSANVIAFECPPGKEIGYTSFGVSSRVLGMLFFQGAKHAEIPAANKALGRNWYDVFMGRIIHAYKPMQATGIELQQNIDSEEALLARRVRDRYFRGPKGGSFFRLASEKPKVQRALRSRPA